MCHMCFLPIIFFSLFFLPHLSIPCFSIAILILTTWQHYCELTEISTWRLHHVHLLLLSDDILTITILYKHPCSCGFIMNIYAHELATHKTCTMARWFKCNFSINLSLLLYTTSIYFSLLSFSSISSSWSLWFVRKNYIHVSICVWISIQKAFEYSDESFVKVG